MQEPSFAVLAGINLQDLKDQQLKEGWFGNDLNFDFNGYHAGINIQIPVLTKIFLQPGFLISQKRNKDVQGLSSLEYRISYFEIPINFVFKTLGSIGYFMAGLGPYAGYAINGKAFFEDNSQTTKSKIEFKNVIKNDDPLTVYYIRPFDAGGNIFLGYELQEGFFMQLNIQIGMTNMYPEDNRLQGNNLKLKNSVFGISAGYRF